MKKQLICLIAIFAVLIQGANVTMAKSTASNPVKVAIKKYKIGNYTGCLQDCQSIVRRDPSNSVAYYYMAMSYVQAGKKDEAIGAYSKVLSLNPKTRLFEYATTGKRCLETPDKCVLEETGTVPSTDMDKFIASPSDNVLSDKVKSDLNAKRLNGVKNEINNGKDVDSYELRKFRDYTNSRSQIDVKDDVVQKKPTNDEIVAALKVLNAAGLNPYAQVQQSAMVSTDVQQQVVNPYAQPSNYQNPEMAQLSALMGGNTQGQDSNAMANMIPFMLAQSKGGNTSYSPQMMQAVIMNSMMPDFSLDENKDKDK